MPFPRVIPCTCNIVRGVEPQKRTHANIISVANKRGFPGFRGRTKVALKGSKGDRIHSSPAKHFDSALWHELEVMSVSWRWQHVLLNYAEYANDASNPEAPLVTVVTAAERKTMMSDDGFADENGFAVRTMMCL